MKILAVDMRTGQVRICNKSSTPYYVSAIIRIKHFLLGLRSRPISYVCLSHPLILGVGAKDGGDMELLIMRIVTELD
jgi:hypothetical protein